MSDEQKMISLGILRDEFLRFKEAISKVKGLSFQLHQAHIKIEEAHMWLQNAIITYVEPSIPTPVQADKSSTPTEDNIEPAVGE